jgi:hypothetical protein
VKIEANELKENDSVLHPKKDEEQTENFFGILISTRLR